MTLLKVENITKAFGGLYALQSVSFEIRRNLITALIGPNGAGKTTLLNVINGLLKPDSGMVQLEGEEITHLPPHEIAGKGISRTFQILKVDQKLTVLEYLMVGRHLATHSGILACICSSPRAKAENKETERAALESLSLFGLKPYANTALSILPHGIHRLVEITRALINDPKLVLFDEPTSGLNPKEVGVLLEALRSIKQKGITIFMIEHNMRLVMNVADWVTVLNFGQKITEGRPSEISKNSEVIEAYLGRKVFASAS
jgi:ABC-type branched-subunit amino acid transport system ATPase component